MNTESIPQRLAHKARVILVTCLFIISTIFGWSAPVSAQAALQTAAPDLAITQVADQETVSTGDPVGFTITVTNNGGEIANSVALTDTVPTAAELSWSVSGTDAAACTITAGVVSCNFGDMFPGAVKTIRLTSPTQFFWGKGFCPTISSTATVMATNQPTSRSATASTDVLCPSVYIQLLADNQDSQNIPAGDPVSFTVKFGNMGEGIARDVLAEIALPTNPGLSWSIMSSIPAEAANNCIFGTDYNGTYELICSFDQMTPGQEVSITLTSPTTSASCGTVNSIGYLSLTNGAWVRYIMKPPIITCTVDLAITQVADHGTVSTGDPVGFTITITNNGTGIASGVTLTDTLPTTAELSWSVDGTDAAACAITAGAVSCNFGDMAPGAVKTIRLASPTRYLGGTGFCPTISSTATVMATNQPEDKSATASTQVLCPHVYLTVGSDTQNVTAGDPISYIFIAGNEGEGIARNVDTQAELPNNPGLNWSITNVTPTSAASNCALETSGTYRLLSCLFDELAAGQEVAITVSSPTTSASCGTLSSGGGAFPGNGPGVKAKYADIIVSCTVSETIQPGEAATLTLPGGRGQLEFPADLVTVPTTFTYTEQDAPSQPLGSNMFAGLSFTLVATDPDGNTVTLFPASYTIRLTYQDSDWQSAGIADEGLLNLAYWETASSQWVNVLPCEGCFLDKEQNRLVAVFNHLTEFALIGSIATDAEPPSTSASVSPEASASGWNVGLVTITLSASDSDSGVHNTEYSLNGSGWTTYNAPFVVSSESTSSTVHNTVQYRSTDEAGNVEETKSLTIQIDMTAPTVGASVPLSGNAVQGGIKFGVKLTDSLSGPAGVTLSIREADGTSGKEIGHENLAAVYNNTSGNWELSQPFDTTQLPDGSYVLLATGKDVAGNEKTEIIPFSVYNNTAPTANPGGPYLGAVNTAISFDGSASSDPDGDPLTYAWDFGDSSTAGTGETPTHSYTAAGVHSVCLTVNDGSAGSDQACTIAVVYDPSAGFVTGGGWIDSPAGAYKADESLAGKATFGFVSKYQKGASVPTGTTAFEFDLAGMTFASQSYEWLVVNKSGTNAQFKGSGLINGTADPNGDAYKFQLWAGDGSSTNSADTFRIKIWWEDALGVEILVYDNGTAQAIGAGNIVVHTGK